MINFKNKKILLVGASGVLGSEYAKFFHDNGAKLIVSDIKSLKYQKLLSKIKKAKHLYCDLVQEKEIIQMVKKAANFFNGLDGVIINAAATQESLITNKKNNFPPFEKYPLEWWEKSIKVNLTAGFLIARETIKYLKKSKGSLVFVSSTYGLVGPDHKIYKGEKFKSIPAYSTSKAGVIGLAKWLATWLGDNSVRVNVLTPGGVYNNHTKTFTKKYSERTPLNRMAKSTEMNGILGYLMSDESSYATGQNFIIDGGYTAK